MDHTPEPLSCPYCGRVLKSLGLVLSFRDEDKQRMCRHAWKCPEGHIWWHWADQPAEPLEACPYPQLFRR